MDNSDDGDRFLLPPASSDELSSFLRQIISRSSTTQPSPPPPYTANLMLQQAPERIASADEILYRSSTSVSGEAVSFPAGGADKYTFENKVKMKEKVQTRQRNLLKRNIDAQFHNMSEKRRRSKINEKMKALQKLIPNSNKTDKASMLEEAIEYLKQLQLQVQALAVMNGFGLNPMRLPPVRVNQTSQQQNLNLETLFHNSHHHETPEATQAM